MDASVTTDVAVVGARCAGSAFALCLARLGHRVLVVDQATFPSDMKLSTHLVWHAGVDLLQKWGLLERLERAGTPLLTELSLDLGELVLRGKPPGTKVNAAIAPVNARVVVGADGRTSEVARAVSAAGYHEFPAEKCTTNI